RYLGAFWGCHGLAFRRAGAAESRPGAMDRLSWHISRRPPSTRRVSPRTARCGWVVGDNIMLDERYAEGQDDRLHTLAAELARLPVDAIVASPTPAILAARKATETIPIIGIGMDNPVQNKLAASLSHPGSNVTGLSYGVGPEIFGKDLELLRALMPDVRRVA